jgi:ketosteroid isomerase-like protein
MTAMPLEDRIALQDLMTDYCYAVDTLSDINGLLDLFTDDVVFDFTRIGLPLMNGKEDVRTFFDRVFADMTHHAHHIGNFRVDSYDGSKASMRAYVQGLGRARDGNTVDVHVCYYFDCVRTDAGWKCRKYWMHALMPLPGSLAEIHADKEGEDH